MRFCRSMVRQQSERGHRRTLDADHQDTVQIIAARLAGLAALRRDELEHALAVIAWVGMQPRSRRPAAVAGDAVTLQTVTAIQLAAGGECFVVEFQRLRPFLGFVIIQAYLGVSGRTEAGFEELAATPLDPPPSSLWDQEPCRFRASESWQWFPQDVPAVRRRDTAANPWAAFRRRGLRAADTSSPSDRAY